MNYCSLLLTIMPDHDYNSCTAYQVYILMK